MTDHPRRRTVLYQSDLFLLERWQKDSLLSMEAQREQIFSEFIQLGVRSREPYRIQKRQNRLNYVDDLPADSQELLQRVRQPDIRRDIVNNQLILWLRTCYGPDSEPAWNTSHDEEMSRLLEEDMICNDESLYNFGLNWERIFLLRPEILETGRNVQKYEEETQSALSEVVESEANSSQGADDSLDPVEALDMDRDISFSYHRMRSLNRIHIVDATTLASDGPDAGKVLIVFFDELGQTVRYARDELDEAVEHTALTNIYLEDHLCWAYANIGELYQRGHPLGPPYSENFGGDS